MKRRVTGLLILLLMLCVRMTAYAADEGIVTAETEVTIQAEIPQYHIVTVKAEGGSVLADGKACKGELEMERQSAQAWTMKPDAGNRLDKLYYNGQDVTEEVKDGIYTAPPLIEDVTLEARFAKDTSDPGKDGPKDEDKEKPGGGDSKDDPKEQGETSAKTGDNSRILLWSVLLIVFAAGAAGEMIWMRHRRKET